MALSIMDNGFILKVGQGDSPVHTCPQLFRCHPNLDDGVNRNIVESEIEGGAFLDDAVVRDSSPDHCKKWYVRKTGKSTKAAERDLKRAKIPRRDNFSPLCWNEDFSNFQFAGRVSNPNEYLSGTPLSSHWRISRMREVTIGVR